MRKQQTGTLPPTPNHLAPSSLRIRQVQFMTSEPACPGPPSTNLFGGTVRPYRNQPKPLGQEPNHSKGLLNSPKLLANVNADRLAHGSV